MNKILCKCGCGNKLNALDKYGRKRYYIQYHNTQGRYKKGEYRIYLPIKEMINLYNTKSIKEISKIYNVDSQTIRSRLKKYIKLRNMSENTKLAWKTNKYKLKNPGMNWKGGRKITSSGYVQIYKPNHPNAVKRFILEHRYVMEQKIGRLLKETEIVHHLNNIKDDNRPENLIIVSRENHYGEIVCPCCNYKYFIK